MNEPLHEGWEDALGRLRDHAGSETAPEVLEAQLVAAFRAHHATPGKRRGWLWAPMAIAASLVLAVAVRMQEPVKVIAPSVPLAVSPARSEIAAPTTVGAAPKTKTPARRRVRPAGPRPSERLSLASARPAPEEREFIGIPYAPPLTAYDQGQVVRVNMAGSSARRMGVPVMLDRVQADLVVGNDGLPRAIRLVSNSGSQFR